MGLFPMNVGSGGTGEFEVIKIYNFYTENGKYNDIPMTCDKGDYVVLSSSRSSTYVTDSRFVETSEITVPYTGYQKIYKISNTINNETIRVLMQETHQGGALVQLRK